MAVLEELNSLVEGSEPCGRKRRCDCLGKGIGVAYEKKVRISSQRRAGTKGSPGVALLEMACATDDVPSGKAADRYLEGPLRVPNGARVRTRVDASFRL